MPKPTKTELIAAAIAAARRARPKYSGFHVGAALLTRKGAVITGANVESASYGLTCCAERIALFKALTDGHDDFVAVAVVGPADHGPTPCGACRQLLVEYAYGAKLWTADSRNPRRIRSLTVRGLLPHPFRDVPAKRKRD